jgi:hypothetical protein
LGEAAEMGPRARNFNLLHPGNRGLNLCYAHLHAPGNETNVRLDFLASRRVGPGLILAFFEGQRAALGSPEGGALAFKRWTGCRFLETF